MSVDVRPTRRTTAPKRRRVVDPSARLRAVTYCRISLDDERDGKGVERQQSDTDRLCTAGGFDVVEQVVDNDRSASRRARREREGWLRVLDLAKNGLVDVIVVYDLDRLVRQPKELEVLIDLADDGLTVVGCEGLIDLSTANGRTFARIRTAMAEQEVENVARRQRAKHAHDAAHGLARWGNRPFGYEVLHDANGKTTGVVGVVEHEAIVVRQMYEWIGRDGLSATAVARRLNERGIATTQGKLWQSAGVKWMIVSKRNLGLRELNGETFTATWPALVDEELWRAANATLAAITRGRNGGRRTWTSGLVKCAICGHSMNRTNQRANAAYRCPNRRDGTPSCGNSISAVRVDEELVRWVLAPGRDVRGTKATTASTEALDVELREIDETLIELSAMLGNGTMKLAAFKAAQTPLVERRENVERQRARLGEHDALARAIGKGTLEERWPKLDDETKARVARRVIDRVLIARATANAWQPERIDVVPKV